jgi:hypothetical protein
MYSLLKFPQNIHVLANCTLSQKSAPKKHQRKGTNIDNGTELTFLLKHFDHFTCKEYGNIITEIEYSVITVKCAAVH